MKRILHKIMVCCAAVLLCTACNSEDDMPCKAENGNNIIIDISSGALPVSRATVEATGAEIAVSHIDVLFFKEDDGSNTYHERIQMNTQEKTGTITLTKGSDEFDKNTRYWVYLIANSAHEAKDFSSLANLDALKQMTETTENIHMTGLDNVTGAPMTFLMDGVAYEGDSEPSAPASVMLNSDDTTDKLLKVTLRRAAAKIVVRISKGEKVTFDRGAGTDVPGYYVRNMPYTTSVIAGVNAPAQLKIPTRNNGGYLHWTENEITVTAYTYAHKWGTGSDFQNKVRMVVNIPLTYKDNDTAEPEYRGSNWYQILVSESKVLARNTYYEVTATVNALGGVDPTKPLELTDLQYSVVEWEGKTVSVGGEKDKVQFLYVNEDEIEMHNMERDNTTLKFNSSSKVNVEIRRAYFIDKFGQEQDVDNTILNQIKVTPANDLTGGIEIYSPNPTNNTIRYIKLEVTNEENITREVIVMQYPLEYITNIQGWYSYRDDFGGTNWELLAGQDVIGKTFTNNQRISDWICGCSWGTNGWSYSKNGTGFFGSKVATPNDDGTSVISYSRWSESGFFVYSYTQNTSRISSLNNARMYHVRLTASSGEYTLGKPRITNDVTDPGEDNAKLVSPSFMIASQLGAVMSANDVNIAASHCKEYVEVYEELDEKGNKTGKKVHLNDWRLPTEKEILIIYKFQNSSDAMDEVLSGDRYWSASGLVTKPGVTQTSDQAIRCIRDAYDTTK